jgi:hypothetical protein
MWPHRMEILHCKGYLTIRHVVRQVPQHDMHHNQDSSRTDLLRLRLQHSLLHGGRNPSSRNFDYVLSQPIVAAQCPHPAILVERKSNHEFSQHQRSENFSLRRSYPFASSLISLWCQSCASIFFAIPSCPTKAVLHVRTQASTPQSI